MRKSTFILSAIATFCASNVVAQTQQSETGQLQQAPFASENAIIDTSIPFAIGAREAQQSLRGSFGWPTFQEGLVEGVYFRFDPDGYARFAPTPRLDTDVFEVICRPRTYSCMGRKGPLSIILNSRGQIELKIDDILSGDRFFVSEGVSEIEVPERILQPLDTQLELLLSSGGDLIVRRGENEKDRISLTGFMPVTAYLRWVTARQDYTILPRGWPVPNAVNAESGLTQSASWQSPMPQPQNFAANQATGTTNLSQQPTPTLQVQPILVPAATNTSENEVAEVKSELKILRELLMEKSQNEGRGQDSVQMHEPQQTGSIATLMPDSMGKSDINDQIAALQKAANQIQADIQRLTQPTVDQSQHTLSTIQLNPQVQPRNLAAEEQRSLSLEDPTLVLAQRMQYLTQELGLDSQTALTLLQIGQKNAPNTEDNSNQTSPMQIETTQNPAKTHEELVAQILKELESDFAPRPTADATPSAPNSDEFQLLSRYFKSVSSGQ